MNGLSSTKKTTILVVDDTPDELALMSNLLKGDYTVKIANGGEKALKIAASDSPPDLILLDIMMSGMDGYEVCRRLKHNQKTMNIPVIFITAKFAENDELKGLELGAVDYIIKPINPHIVMARVKNHLALNSMADFPHDQNDWDAAERLAYALKGYSGSVGAAGLQQLAEKLDAAIKARRSHEGSNDWPDGPTLIAQITREMREAQHKTNTPPVAVNREKIKAICDHLEALLANDDAEAADVLDANAEILNEAFPEHCREIDNYIRSFNFEAALASLRTAAEKPLGPNTAKGSRQAASTTST